MNTYMVDCGDWGECRVDAESKGKAKYKAYLKWADAYRPIGEKNPFLKFLKCIVAVVKIGRDSD